MKMTRGFNCFLHAGAAALALLCASGLLCAEALAQDISGGAGEGVKRAESPARKRPKTQPKSTKRTARAKAPGTTNTSAPKPPDLGKQVEAALELGNAARDGNPPQYDSAERAYKLASALDADDPRPYLGLGNTYFDQKRYKEAEAAFRRAAELDPEDADAFVALAYAINAQERYDEAERHALRAIALDADNFAAYVAAGWSHYRRKNYAQAENSYRKAITLSPQTAELYSELSTMLMEQGRWRDAEPMLKHAVALDPADTAVLIDYGVVLHKLGQLDRAAEAYSQAFKQDPKLSTPHSNLALIRYTRGDFTRAREEWEAAVRLNSQYALDRAGLLILERKFSEAEAQLQQYTQANAADEDGWLLLGDVLRMQGKTEGARAAYTRAAQLAPDYAQLQRPTIPAPPEAKPAIVEAKKETTTPAAAKSSPAPVATNQGGEPSASEPQLRYAAKVRTINATNFAKATTATGSISVASDANVSILVEPLAGGEALLSVVPSSVKVVAFNQLRPGEYRIVASRDGYETVETKVFVAVTRVVSVKLSLRPKQ